jgi:hypothetical protein
MGEFPFNPARSLFIRVAHQQQGERLREIVEMSQHVRARCTQVLHRSALARASAQRALDRADRGRRGRHTQRGPLPAPEVQ